MESAAALRQAASGSLRECGQANLVGGGKSRPGMVVEPVVGSFAVSHDLVALGGRAGPLRCCGGFDAKLRNQNQFLMTSCLRFGIEGVGGG